MLEGNAPNPFPTIPAGPSCSSSPQPMRDERAMGSEGGPEADNMPDTSALEEALLAAGDLQTGVGVHDVSLDAAHRNKVFGSEDEDAEIEDDKNMSTEEALLQIAVAKIKAKYQHDGKPDLFHFKFTLPRTVEDSASPTQTQNDYHLTLQAPVIPFSNSLLANQRKYEAYGLVSAYNPKKHEYTPITEKLRPMHGHTEGGKGLTYYTRPVLYQKAGMSSILNWSFAYGCPSNCSFCKEAIIARGYAETNVYENTGTIRVRHPETGEEKEFPAKTKVRFYDAHNKLVVLGPLQVPVAHEWPIAKDSLKKLFSGHLARLSAD